MSKPQANHFIGYRLLDNLVVECWHRMREVPGSIPSQGQRHDKDVIKMVPVVPLFSTPTNKAMYNKRVPIFTPICHLILK